MKMKKITYASILVAIGVVGGYFIYFPIGVSKCSPVQHIVNVLSAVLLGPGYATLIAFCISVIRNILGTGTLLAFPGSMIGAFLAGFLYKKTGSKLSAASGEIFGTGLLGSIAAWPIANLILKNNFSAFFFLVPFLINTVVGSILALIILKALDFTKHSIENQQKGGGIS